jgi:hypothetical protein
MKEFSVLFRWDVVDVKNVSLATNLVFHGASDLDRKIIKVVTIFLQ